MKMRRMCTVIVCLALLLALFSGCAAKSDVAVNMNGALYEEYTGSAELGGAGSDKNTGSDVLTDRKLIRRVSVEAETEDMDALLSQLDTRLDELEGYIESRNIQNGSRYSTHRTRYAKLVIRIPAPKLDAFLSQVSEASNVVSTVETSDDVTLEYVATESRLNVLRTEEQRLLTFLSEAKSVSEMLDIEERLTEVQSEIESITTQLNTYNNLVDYATVTLTVTEVEVYTQVEEEEPTMWQEICEGFADSIDTLLTAGRELVVFLLANSPYLLLVGLLGLGVWLFIRAYDNRKKKAPQTEKPQE